jgi:4-hydroxy-tetrahydrodipicolinate synthase
VLVGGDGWALEGFCAGATGWVSGVAVAAPAP